MEAFDVVVVGGGIAGVSIAYELAADRSVLLLEREDHLAAHTTGRSAAVYFPNYGNETVRGLTRASRQDFDRLARELEAPPLLSPRQVMYVSDVDDATSRAVLATGGSTEVDLDEAHRRCSALRADRLAWAAVADAMDIDVMALHAAYVRGLRRRDGQIRREAPVTGLRPEGDGWTVSAGDAVIRAEVVVDAAGAWGDVVAELAGVAPAGLEPRRRTIFTTPVEAPDAAGWPLVVDAQERFYFKPEGPQLLVSPADETPVAPGDDRIDELDVARTIDAVNAVTSLGLRQVTALWAGQRTFAPDRSPVVGVAPGAPGFVWFCGQGGYGIQMAPALARTGAALLRGDDLPDDVTAEGVTQAQVDPARFALA